MRLKHSISRSVLTLSVLTTALTSAYSAGAETLWESVNKAIDNNPRIEVALTQIDAAEQKRIEERSAYFPVLRAGLSGGRIYGDNSTSRGLNVTRGSGYSWLWEGNVAVTQTLFDGLGVRNRHNAAKERIDAANFSRDDVRELLTLETAFAFMDILRAEKSLKILEEQSQALKRYEPQFKILIDQGAVDQSDQNQASDIIASSKNTILDFESQKKSAHARYEMLVGARPDSDLVKPVLKPEKPSELDMAIGLALETHPQIQAAVKEGSAAWHDAEAEKSSFFPKVDSELSYLKKDQRDVIGGEVVDARALVRMNWAFSTGGAEMAKFKQGRKAYQEALAQRRDLEGRLTNQIKDAWYTHEKLDKQREIMDRRLGLSKALLSTRRTQFEGGQISLLQLMQAHNQYYNLQLEALQLGYAAETAHYSVLGAMGNLYVMLTPKLDEANIEPDDEQGVQDFCDRHEKIIDNKGVKGSANSADELCITK